MIDQSARRGNALDTANILDFSAGHRRPGDTDGAAAAEGNSDPAPRARRPATRLDRTCDTAILAIIALPFILAFGALLHRLFGH